MQPRANLPDLALPGTWRRLHSRRAAACFKFTENSPLDEPHELSSAEHITLVFSAIDDIGCPGTTLRQQILTMQC